MPRTVSGDVVISRNLAMPMRDGVDLRADLYRPASGGPWPVLVQRTPYSKSALLPPIGTLDPVRACAEGFAVLIQDVRGRYRSGGEFYPYRHEESDGYDTVEWVAAQPWCGGRVGIYGRSYAGATAWLAAVSRPPHLAAVVPMLTGQDYCEGWTYRHGALEQSFLLGWLLGSLGQERALGGALTLVEFAALADRLPEYLDGSAPPPWQEIFRFAPYARDWLERPYDQSYWGPWALGPRLGPDIAPSLSLGGWFDIFAPGMVDLFSRLQNLDGAGGRHALVMGPWAHVNPMSQVVGQVDFGLRAAPGVFDVHGALLNWFKRWLVGPEAARLAPAVQAFAMGANRWISGERWPLGTATTTFYLEGDGRAKGSGGGRLAPAPSDEQRTDAVIYDASHPVRTLGGSCLPERPECGPGAFDQRPVEARPEVLVYTGPPLREALTVAGAVAAILYASASEGELDLVAKLVDVAPDGFARNVADGVVRSQHAAPLAGRGGEMVEYLVDLGPTTNVFAAGHRIRLDLATSSFPRHDLNPLARGGARHSLGHGGAWPSRVVLPVVEG